MARKNPMTGTTVTSAAVTPVAPPRATPVPTALAGDWQPGSKPTRLRDDPRVPAAQYFGAKGFFSSYDANLDEPLTEGLRSVWEAGLQQLRDGTLEPMRLAEHVRRAESQTSPATGQKRGNFLLAQFNRLSQPR